MGVTTLMHTMMKFKINFIPSKAHGHTMVEQDWPVASELVPGGICLPFCLQRARYDNPIRQMSLGTIGKKTSSSGVSKDPS